MKQDKRSGSASDSSSDIAPNLSSLSPSDSSLHSPDASSRDKPTGLPVWLVVLLALAVAAGVFVLLSVDWLSLVGTAGTVLPDSLLAVSIFFAAGGFGHLILRRLTIGGPSPLHILTAVGLGLYLLSVLMLAVGSFTHNMLRGYVWWPVVVIGLVLAIRQAYSALSKWRRPRRLGWWALTWIIWAAVLAIWLTGASMPPDVMGKHTGDAYDVVEYHLQVPREFYTSQHISALYHNCYSFYPLGVEMLFLLGMILKGGAYEGMYLPAIIHGLLGAMAVAAIYFGQIGPRQQEAGDIAHGGRQRPPCPIGQTTAPVEMPLPRRIFAALLLASMPGIIYLSYIAKTELAQVFYLALALLWLRHWLGATSWKPALCVGLCLGAACATKYLAAAFVALPVLAVMLLSGLGSLRRIGQFAAAGLLCMLMMTPWLIRTGVYTGNPVFPLATQQLGRGHWTSQQEQRWLAAHGSQEQPPVPPPPNWQPTARPAVEQLFVQNLMGGGHLSPPTIVLAALAMLLLIVRRSRDRWELGLCVIIIIQLFLWTFTHQMPWRFISPAAVPLALLAGLLLAGLWRLRWKRMGQVLAMLILLAILAGNILSACKLFLRDAYHEEAMSWSGHEIAQQGWPYYLANQLPAPGKVLLIGQAAAFYFPANSVYATCFDSQLLDELVQQGMGGEEILRQLKARGITHIYVDWAELLRLASTYGFPPSLSEDLFVCLEQGAQPNIGVLDQLRQLGIKELSTAAEEPRHSFQPRLPWAPEPTAVTWPRVSLFSLPSCDASVSPFWSAGTCPQGDGTALAGR